MSLTSVIIISATIYLVMSFFGKIINDVYKDYEWNKQIKENKKKITIDERGDVVRIDYYSKRDKEYKGVIMTKDKFDIEKNNFNPEDELNNIIHLYYEKESK